MTGTQARSASTRGRTGRGRLAAVAVLCAVLGATLSACGEATGDARAPEGAPVRGGTLRYGVEGDPESLNPTSAPFATSGRLIAGAVFDTLAAYDADGTPRPFLAESVEPADDLRSWEIRVRDGVRFHDGTLLDAEAVRINVEAQRDDPLVGLAIQTLLDPEREVEVVDPRTVRVHLAAPNAHFDAHLTTQLGLVASPTWLRAAEEDPDLDQEPVGTGPFRFVRRTQAGTTAFERNADWWGGDVHLDGIEFVVLADPGTRTSALLGDDVDVIHTDHPTEIVRLRRSSGVVSNEDETGEELFVMLNTARAPFDDPRARRALALATPRDDYVETLGAGIVTPAASPFHPSDPWYSEVEQVHDRPEDAAALAAEFCRDRPEDCDGDRIRIEYAFPGPAEAERLTADVLTGGWDAAFVVERRPGAQDAVVTEVALGQYDSVLWRQFGDPNPEVDGVFLDCAAIGPISLNWTRNCNEALQAALERQRATLDPDVRGEAWAEIASEIAADGAYVFLTHTLWSVAARDHVGGVGCGELPDGRPALAMSNAVHHLSCVWLTR